MWNITEVSSPVNLTLLTGGCLKSLSPEGVTLQITNDSEKNLLLKREVIAKYLFNMAFENAQDLGYVTEKPWDALLAGEYCSVNIVP